MVWGWLKRLFAGSPAGPPGGADVPEVAWVAAADNPWGVPVLDVRPVTLTMISTSANLVCAQNAVSYSQEDGTSFAGARPPSGRVAPADLRYRIDRVLADGALFLPDAMEHKWAIFHHGGK